jgi:hypothetical protein
MKVLPDSKDLSATASFKFGVADPFMEVSWFSGAVIFFVVFLIL